MKKYFIVIDKATKNKFKVDITDQDENKIEDKLNKKGFEVVTKLFMTEDGSVTKDNYRWEVRMDYTDHTKNVLVGMDEIIKVYFAYKKQSNIITKGGAITGGKIITILPYYNNLLGWNAGYVPTSEDMGRLSRSTEYKDIQNLTEQIKRICEKAKSMGEANDLLIDTLQNTKLIQ